MKNYIKKIMPIGIKIIGTFFSFLVSIIISKNYNSYGVGIYSLANSINTLLLILAKFGLDVALIKYISIYNSNDQEDNIKKIMIDSFILCSSISLVLIIITFVSSDFISNVLFKKQELSTFLRIFCISLIPLANLNIFSSFYKGKNNVNFGLYIESVIVQSVFSIIMLVNVYIFKNNYINNISYMYMISTLISFFLIMIIFISKYNLKIKNETTDYDFKDVLKTAKPLLLVNATNYIMSSTDTIMLGIWCSANDVGKYNIAIKITLLFSMLISAFNSMFGPKFAVLFSKKAFDELEKSIKKIQKVCLVFAIFLCSLLGFFSSAILSLWGKEFIDAKPILLISLIGQFFVLSKGPLATLLMMCDCERDHRNNTIITSLLNIVLNYFLINIYGVIGAAISTTTCLIIKNILSMRTYNIKIKKKFFNKNAI